MTLVFVVFLAGIGVSLTPCVLPMVPVTIGIIGQQSDGSRLRLCAIGLQLCGWFDAGLHHPGRCCRSNGNDVWSMDAEPLGGWQHCALLLCDGALDVWLL